MRTKGLSPKVVRPLVGGLVGWVALRFVPGVDADAQAAIVGAVMAALGVSAPPGVVVPK